MIEAFFQKCPILIHENEEIEGKRERWFDIRTNTADNVHTGQTDPYGEELAWLDICEIT